MHQDTMFLIFDYIDLEDLAKRICLVNKEFHKLTYKYLAKYREFFKNIKENTKKNILMDAIKLRDIDILIYICRKYKGRFYDRWYLI